MNSSSVISGNDNNNSGFLSRPDSTKNSNCLKKVIQFDEDAFNNISMIKGLSTQD